MKKRFPTLLATLIWTALYSQHTLADLAEQCMLGVPTYDQPLVTGDPNQLPVRINADKTEANYPDNALFTGNVIVQQGNSTLTANQVELTQVQKPGEVIPLRTVTATGDVNYDDPQIKLKGPKGWSNLNTKDTDMDKGKYQMVGRQGRGDADLMKLRDQSRYTILKNGTFTSCLPGDNSWSVVGSEVIHDREEQVVEVWNARFKIGKVPVFYSPYMQLPVGDKRRSGFLIPNAKFTSNNGFEFLLPYYWNIAPNFDATITPHYMERRGLQWQNEFRYLLAPGSGTMALDWLPNDRIYTGPDGTDKNATRWLYYWGHSGVMDQVWRFNINYTRVSDPAYFTDLTSQYGSTTDGYATQIFTAGYANENWNATLSSKQFQVFTAAGNSNAYRAQPQLDMNYYKNDVGPFDMHVYGQAAKFTSVNPTNPEASRFHIEPTVNLPLSNSWGSINTEAKLLATHYQQDIPASFADNASNPKLKDSVNRVLPQFKVDGKVVFDRSMDWATGFTQTLEPRAQYLYVPYRNQDDIYIYDTTLMQSDYSGLFRDRTYSGLDRIASANQVSTGLTSRIYDDARVERFNVSVGQIYYFSRSRTGNTEAIDNSNATGSLVWAGDTFWRINDQLGLKGGAQYDTRLGSLTLGNAIMEYRKDADRMIQLNYRYASPKYIQAAVPKVYNPDYQQGISQVGTTASWPIADRWAIVGAYYYDTKAKQPASQLVGLQYNTCCWTVNLGYERKITGWNAQGQTSKYDNKIGFNIELRGLSGGHSLGTAQMLNSGILPYQSAF
ncbi:LPS-assembly protein LptD [Yersinia pestis subsp. microtus bv. Caucasica]|uniref:LPS assembly protein LptD n=1 Tax=Yersinia pestis TaxID=632 RepID=UPI000381D908|nr:LPS assembly protein LptD [Yersinia pestis]KAA5783659.1 LPS assembly protein LptD [Yersinia pestis]KAA5832162.1 LPS assembly protein LptD [Yersinia pestis]KPD43789.1 LPS biosynthesis protein [Yersinia pestis subsp. microtus bv. Caucasica]KPD49892.1 LPS biosynthesis protein [Yersinia pestis subsp. microtus bv. Caucasica]KPD67720.1 LPS biosynthesis protein [Yersinia pestis subsp. microtus bv. Caucasica]